MRPMIALACGMLLSVAPAMAQAQGPDILTIWQQFSVSNSLASKCVKPDKAKLTKFLENYQIVSTHAALRLKQMNPEWGRDRVDKTMAEHYAAIDKAVSEFLAQETCGGQKTKEALQRFDMQAEMDFSRNKQ
ncbi:hypothetical protein [Azospirillum sp. Marseille-Q6669]